MKMNYIFEEELEKHTLKWTPVTPWLKVNTCNSLITSVKEYVKLSLESQAKLTGFFLIYFHLLKV